MQSRPALPSGHGELLVRPAFEEWPSLVTENRDRASSWDFEVGGVGGNHLRDRARREVLEAAATLSARLGVPVADLGDADAPIVMTGHQPELYHPGVWVKDFLLQRLAEETAASAVDVVVDSDGFDQVSITSPCLSPEVRRCRQYLAVGTSETCYGCAPVPDEKTVGDFCRIGDEMLSTLPAPSVRRHFAQFCSGLRTAREDGSNLAEVVTFARRRYEASAATDYSEVLVSAIARTSGFATFVADIALQAVRFAESYNGELEEYRAASGTRSAAQPFPNLEISCGRVELPLWAIGTGSRTALHASKQGDVVELWAGDALVASLPASDPLEAARSVLESEYLIAPKALLLTLFLRVFACDFFIHGVGGGRYDRVTDGVCRRYYGIEPPAFGVASLTMYLPIGAHVVTDEEVAAAKERLNRMEHNPDAVLGEVEFETADERGRALSLAAEKRELVTAIAVPGADKKTLGKRIRDVNAELGSMLAPMREYYGEQLRSLEAQRDASEVLTDRTYPFCFWSPEEIADKIR